MNSKNPLLIIGMHRSGTTLLSKCMETAGWYGGWRKEKNNESTFYLRINNWLMHNSGCDWETGDSIEKSLNNNYELLASYVAKLEKSIFFSEYSPFFDKKKLLISTSWGFKDPRTTLTLPFWMKYYGDTSLIHIRRHGLDVANSIIVRRNKQASEYNGSLLGAVKKIHANKKAYPTMKLYDINDAIDLWYKYEMACEIAIKKQKSISIKYEDLLTSPDYFLKQIFEFSNLNVEKKEVTNMVGKFDKTRCFAFKKSPYIKDLTEDSVSKIERFGYVL
jgi:LPS sulfotransferase NodH